MAGMAEGSVNSNPVIDLVLRATAATAPELHPIAAVPFDAEISATLRGLPTSRRSPGRCGFGNCRRAAAASRSPMRACSRAR